MLLHALKTPPQPRKKRERVKPNPESTAPKSA
jgi:hypothetical protein